MGLQFFLMNFHGCISFILSQNAYHAVILGHLNHLYINRYIKTRNIESKVVSPSQLYVDGICFQNAKNTFYCNRFAFSFEIYF